LITIIGVGKEESMKGKATTADYSHFRILLKGVCLTVGVLGLNLSPLLGQCGAGYQQERLDWQSANWGPGFVGTNNYLLHGTNVGISISGSFGNTGSGNASPADDNSIRNRGGYGDTQEQLAITDNSRRATVRITINFDQPVYNLRFSLYDVDSRDFLNIRGNLSGSARTPAISYESFPTRDFNIIGQSLYGNGGNSNNGDGTANIRFATGVTQVIITTNNTSRPDFALTDLTMCVPTVSISSACSNYAAVNWDLIRYNPRQVTSQIFPTHDVITSIATGITADFRWNGNTPHMYSGTPSNPSPGSFQGNGGIASTNNGLEIMVDPPNGNGSSVTLNIRLSQVVSEGRFNISDIDNSYNLYSNSNRIDQVTITASNGGVPAAVSFIAESDGASFGKSGNTLTGHPFGNIDGCTSRPGVGGSTNGNAEADRGTVNVYINGSFDRINITYREAGNALNPYIRGIELDNVVFCLPTLLPFDLISFKGAVNYDKIATLDWEVEDHKDISSFEVEYTADGGETRKIGSVKNEYNSNTFSFKHKIESAVGYYRLKMIHGNGEFKYSDFITLTHKVDVNKDLLVQTQNNEIEIANIIKGSTLEIIDIQGKTVSSSHYANSKIKINTTFLQPGIYLVRGTSKSNIQTGRFLVSN